jgi:hypothetical protein
LPLPRTDAVDDEDIEDARRAFCNVFVNAFERSDSCVLGGVLAPSIVRESKSVKDVVIVDVEVGIGVGS